MENQSYYWLIILLVLIGGLAINTAFSRPQLIGGFIDGPATITLFFDKTLTELPPQNNFHLVDSNDRIMEIKAIHSGEEPRQLVLTTVYPINIKLEYFIQFEGLKKRLIMNKIYQLPEYFNRNIELGAIYGPTETTFRLFVPRATAVTLLIYEKPIITPNEAVQRYDLRESSGGIWEISLAGDLAGKFYTYRLTSLAPDCQPELEVVDPYAKVVTRGDGQSLLAKNGFYQTIGRGMIVDLSQTGTVSPIDNEQFEIADAIIYETHVRDFTRDPNSGVPVHKQGLFIGAAQPKTHFHDFATGLEHLVELGINVVQLHPVNEFWVMDEHTYKQRYIDYKDENGNWHQREYYNWGYAPINYFSPEGWYATGPDNYSRISELKQLISEFHRRGIRVTLDVVFNHTFEGSRDQFAHWLFRGIDTDYYYRTAPDGQFYDGIFCGNEVKTENPMVAKYILDCLKYWVTEFKIDGFRFDWMSAIDPVTLNQIVRGLRQLNPKLLIYGELWTLRGLSYAGANSGTYVDRQHVGLFEQDFQLPPGSIAGFNDYFRDAVKGSGFQRDYAGGYIQNVLTENYYAYTHPHELVKLAIKGMIDFVPCSEDSTEWQGIRSPLNSINYIACHDGFTLYDKLIIAAYCEYQQPGQPDSPKQTYPRSAANPRVVDFTDQQQFKVKNIESELKKMDKLGAAILFTAQGIPFMHSGQEFLRQKIKLVPANDSLTGEFYEFDPNSNTSPDAVNAIQWALKEKNYDVFRYYQGLILLRKEHPTFRRRSAESVREGLAFYDEWCPENSDACLAYELSDPENKLPSESWKQVVVLINPYSETKIFQIPAARWEVVVNAESAGVATLDFINGGTVPVEPISMIVLHQ